MPQKIFDRTQPFNAVYAFVNPENDTEFGKKNLEQVLAAEGPGNQFLDMDSMEILFSYTDGILYRFDIDVEKVEKAYGYIP